MLDHWMEKIMSLGPDGVIHVHGLWYRIVAQVTINVGKPSGVESFCSRLTMTTYQRPTKVNWLLHSTEISYGIMQPEKTVVYRMSIERVATILNGLLQ